jgi:predicted phosphodiesterase
MRSATTDRTWTLAAIMACLAVVTAGLALPMVFTANAEVEGGVILSQSANTMTVRCLAPDMTISLGGFAGEVILTNCFPNTTVVGGTAPPTRTGSEMRCQVSSSAEELRVSAVQKSTELRFAVLGDSQGHNYILAKALELVGGCEFVIHCGDITPSSRDTEFDAFEDTIANLTIPMMTTPGNHDVKLGSYGEYSSRFGPSSYSFDYGGTTFAFVDSSDATISEDEIDWLKEVYDGKSRKVLVTHMPSYDPFGDNHTLDAASCDRMQAFVLEENVDAVFTGHIHAYHYMRVENTDLTITGGAGGTLVDGVHHFVIVTVNETGFHYEKIDLEDVIIPQGPYIQFVGRAGTTLNVTYEELMEMDVVNGYSSYENQFSNIGGQGTYTGVAVRDLINLVGGMLDGDTLRVTSTDTYYQDFGYLNVYPDQDWLDLQGEMIVALDMDDLSAPEWEEGPRLAMIPQDGLYSNSDCELTSYYGQGYSIYPSAGARWVKNVMTITVMAGGT